MMPGAYSVKGATIFDLVDYHKANFYKIFELYQSWNAKMLQLKVFIKRSFLAFQVWQNS